MRHDLAGDAVVRLDDPRQEPEDGVVDRVLRGRHEHLVDRRLRAEHGSVGEPVLGARAIWRGARRAARNASPTICAVRSSSRRGFDEQVQASVQVRDPLPEARRALERQDAHRHGPPTVQLAEHALGGNDDVVEEHLGELGHPVDHLDRCDGDAGGVHVDEEGGDAPVARVGGARARQEDAAVRVVRQARPHLLTVDDPGRRGLRVAVGSGTAAQRCEVAPRSRLREPLTPHLGAREQTRDDLGGELRRREVDERGRENLDE